MLVELDHVFASYAIIVKASNIKMIAKENKEFQNKTIKFLMKYIHIEL